MLTLEVISRTREGNCIGNVALYSKELIAIYQPKLRQCFSPGQEKEIVLEMLPCTLKLLKS